MEPTILSLRLDAEHLAALDAIARAQGVDRETVATAALEQHIAYYHWSCAHIQKAIEDPELASEADVAAEFARWKARP